MKLVYKILKNKFILASTLFFVYTLFLDDNDIFTMISQSNKLHILEVKKSSMDSKLLETKTTLNKLKYRSEVERFAREEKYFKKDDEDVFVVFYE